MKDKIIHIKNLVKNVNPTLIFNVGSFILMVNYNKFVLWINLLSLANTNAEVVLC